MSGKPTVISTFAGCGGSSLGYQWAGFDELLAIEWDDNAVATFKLNFLHTPIWQRDMREVTGQEILEFTGLKKGELDVLDGSPPCQGFSTAGKMQVNDTRNDLSYEFIRLIEALQPKVFVMENVTGMVKGKMKGRFKEIMRALKATGYQVKCKLMNSMYYEVPQARQRLIWIGAREGEPEFPKPSMRIQTVREALEQCPIGLSDGEFTGERLCLALHIGSWGNGSDVIKGSFFNLKRLAWNKPSRTILKSVGRPNSSYGGGLIHPELNRHLTISELKRIASFPDNFQLIGTFQEQWGRIGNAVMPKFMEHIARTIKTDILGYS